MELALIALLLYAASSSGSSGSTPPQTPAPQQPVGNSKGATDVGAAFGAFFGSLLSQLGDD